MPELHHYLLFAESGCSTTEGPSWRFLLQDVTRQHRLVVTDHEPSTCGERLELLAVVRGLEAIDGPARVTLVTKSRYVSRGLKTGLTEWRNAGWQWEHFGRFVPVKDHDLWQRVDRALQFHDVDCQAWVFGEESVDSAPLPSASEPALRSLPRRDNVSSAASAPASRRHRRSATSSRRPSGSRVSWGKMGRRILDWVDVPGTASRLVPGAT